MREDYYQNKSPHYGAAHTRQIRILELMGNEPKKILDVGCATGYIGEKAKKIGHFVVGIDVSALAIEQAKTKLDQAYTVNIEKEWPKEVLDQKFDAVIIAETLEHVFEPECVLRQVHHVLVSGGSVIITTPNFLFWYNRFIFLFGLFKYQDQGMFDFGHIRWFTYAYLQKVLSNSGFHIEAEKHIIFPGKLTRILKYFPSLFAFQFIVKARKL